MDTAPRAAFRPVAVFGASLRATFAHAGFLFPLAFAPTLALAAISYGIAPTYLDDPTATVLTGPTAAALLVDLLGSTLIGGMLCLAALDAILGRRHGVGAYLRQALRHLPAMFVLSALVGVATMLGLFLLVLPGLYLCACYIALFPAILFENRGWQGLARARALSEGFRWPIVGALVLYGVAVAAAILLGSMLVDLASVGGGVVLALELLAQTLFTMANAIFGAQIYLRLREVAEGETRAAIAAGIG